jgi:hypothetical protein
MTKKRRDAAVTSGALKKSFGLGVAQVARPGPSFQDPQIIACFRRNAVTQVRVILDRVGDCPVVDIRNWIVPLRGGEATPMQSGLSISVKHLAELVAGLVEALERAKALGLLAGADEPRTLEGAGTGKSK